MKLENIQRMLTAERLSCPTTTGNSCNKRSEEREMTLLFVRIFQEVQRIFAPYGSETNTTGVKQNIENNLRFSGWVGKKSTCQEVTGTPKWKLSG
jgi:hypothetical protein